MTSIKGVKFILRASKTCESITLVLHIIHLAPSDLRPANLSILFARDPHHCVYPQVRALPTVDQRPRKSNVSLRIIPSNRLQHITSSRYSRPPLRRREKKTSLHRVIPPSKTRNSRSRPKPFLSNQELRPRRSRDIQKGKRIA